METRTTDRRGPVQAGPETQNVPDVGMPPQPEEFCGISLSALQRLGRAASDTCALPPRYSQVVCGLEKILPYASLIETVVQDTPRSIEPHLPAIKQVAAEFIPGLRTADRVTRHIPPLQRKLDDRVTKAILGKGPELGEAARAKMEQVRPEVDFLSSFDNPRQQLTEEAAQLAARVSAATLQARDERISGSVRVQSETPKGILGIAVRIVRSVKNFFGRLFGKQNDEMVSRDITAQDAGLGLARAIHGTALPENRQKFQLISRYITPHIQTLGTYMTPDKLALAAPELLTFIYSLTPDDETGKDICASVEQHPHELRFVTDFKRRYGRYDLDRIQRASRTLLPALRDVLPTKGMQVRESYERIYQLLGMGADTTLAPKESSRDDESKPAKAKWQPIRVVMRRLIGPETSNAQEQQIKQPTFLAQARRLFRSESPTPRQPWRIVARRLFGR
jgi:hypothetical protein